ncbi:4-hydroxyphenylacetate 3-monooxygenase, oxygenase component [Anoxybacillus rupiensis]|uniref:4-hydroxyphenylacetate 3-monooxygenase, oxygenase component n=1 Tax=Anoxybacteroides rupiense TaxID=311460 RepID=A0ABD5IRD7_9BACL|nr:4-hydroxyphenylacetate 3-monooxygenase, oxygenase component [Anoxybacillus rupiensis]MBB3906850.1 4-hydroxyphenylacetate 3-monooxygenase [Anoxybacillus rupiensis]MBS2770041.1 4-hydroxyphenylacetate 3-monooxygenase, oxygenase component [Anoxybacillus rupiensis]MDE8562586.1 4-hydroxyphenylacetate 3-monooxygenase, oxygenase component [Anoxybacillus rupiensis]MED5050832.1 4-hydroxyphenylacetate 3-monooxygenase, oxygenase component [Anoxybacillus rupiensis]
MGIIRGSEYIERIDNQQADVWIDGTPVTGKRSEHPAFSGIMRSQAKLYDAQHHPDKQHILTFRAPNGELVGASFLRPTTKEDLEKRRLMFQEWAKISAGMMGRSPDYMNTAVMALAAAADMFAEQRPEYGEHVRHLYEQAMKHDWSFTHTFINPQKNRSLGYIEDNEEIVAAKVVDETADGIVLKGARLLATQGGITDELLVLPAGGNYIGDEYIYAFSLPTNTPGLKFICRPSFAGGSSAFNYPLSSRFDEVDALVVFDHVLVPWDRVFLYKNAWLAKELYTESHLSAMLLHQVLSRRVVKTEYFLGVVHLLIESIQIAEYQHVKEKASEIAAALEALKALLLASEREAKPDRRGTMIPALEPLSASAFLYPRMYPRFAEIVQLLGASGLVCLPTEKDFASPIRSDLDRYLQAATLEAEDRVQLFRLAWDMTMSAFGTRQTLYERFFFGDPAKFSVSFYNGYDKTKCVQMVQQFLESTNANG